MKIVGHTDYQTTANVYTHIKEEMLKKATVDLDGVFKKGAGGGMRQGQSSSTATKIRCAAFLLTSPIRFYPYLSDNPG